MAVRSRYLLTYDIRDERRLRHVHKAALAFGDPLQYSVFVCDLTAAERVHLREALRELIDESTDAIAVFDLGPATGRGIACVEYLGAQRPASAAGEVIW